jgi:alpha-ketoglutarate-dependent 2,4-dichlorophenoxyacetate dioxygenase
MQINALHPLFAVEVIGADIAAPDAALVARVTELMDEHAVVVLRDQGHTGDDAHIRFSQACGALELPPGFGAPRPGKPRFRPELYDASNLDDSGEIASAQSLRHKFAKGNELFHADSSFNHRPTSWSLLKCYIATPERGCTELVDGRAVWDALPEEMKARLDGTYAEHNFWVSRERGGLPQSDAAKATPGVRQPVAPLSPSGRKTLYVGSHLYKFEGMTPQESEVLLYELLAFVGQPRFVYAHQWRVGDLVIWDNRCTFHRATEFDYLNHKRDLRRTTISEGGPDPALADHEEMTAA